LLEYPVMETRSNPWKVAFICAAIGIPATVLAFAGGARLLRNDSSARVEVREVEQPSARVIEDCNRYASAYVRDNARIAKNGLVGGAVGAGVGAAGGAIADGGKGAGKGAGIGAIVGATGGVLYGLNEENKKSEAAQQAYRECLARQG
jgi:hypothetical protein